MADHQQQPPPPQNAVPAAPFRNLVWLISPTFSLTTALWLTSLTAALSTHNTFKSTDLYLHFNLSRFDHKTIIPLLIFLLHASLYFLNRGAPLLDLTIPNHPHHFIRFLDSFLWIPVRIISLRDSTLHFFKDHAMAMCSTHFTLFFICFLRAVAPGFGGKLTVIAMVTAGYAAAEASRFIELAPYFLLIFCCWHYFFVECDERRARARFAADLRARRNGHA